ncbi:MAG: hypothetical protein H0V87_07650 [Chloroflexi bacterium]|nr:hypothetical protein [Chloroflexota bacterium]
MTAPPATPSATQPPAPAGSPAQTVASFYSLVERHRFDEAANLWTASMRERYPPATNINGRFAETVRIDLNRNEVVQQDADSAVVAVDLTEFRSSGEVRRYVGSWDLVLTDAGWRMDDPDLSGG